MTKNKLICVVNVRFILEMQSKIKTFFNVLPSRCRTQHEVHTRVVQINDTLQPGAFRYQWTNPTLTISRPCLVGVRRGGEEPSSESPPAERSLLSTCVTTSDRYSIIRLITMREISASQM